VIVVDASAALAALANRGPARRALADAQLHAPHLVDAEVVSGLRHLVTAHRVPAPAASATLAAWQRLGVVRHPMLGLLTRVWELRDNVSAYDATYVALAESLRCPLLTADSRLARAPGTRCPITVVPG
jgi:predicted nucleic acid-binding protein